MSPQITTTFYSQASFLAIKQEAWEVCRQLYDMKEVDYYDRLSVFHSFAVFRVGQEVIGFLSFFVDETIFQNKKIILLGIGHGAVLPAYRNNSLIPAATIQFLFQSIVKKPFKRHFLWGMGMTHLAYRMGRRSSQSFYPLLEEDCPPYYQSLLDWIGQRYYPHSYDSASLTASVNFSILDKAAIPTLSEQQDPVVADFVRRVPSCLSPHNQTGVLTITPIAPNVWFWIKKYIFKRKKK
jgi:hypothetical protein